MKKICLISSAGGHLEELNQLKSAIELYECFYVLTETDASKKLKSNKYLVHDMNRKNKICKLLSMMSMFCEQGKVFLKEKPDVIITTGAAIAIPMCVLGKIFRKKVIYIESFAKIYTPNKTGVFLYKLADVFIVQWKALLERYPKATYGGWIY